MSNVDLYLRSKAMFDALMEVKRNCFTLAGTQLIVRLQRAIDDYETAADKEWSALNKALEERCAENLRLREKITEQQGIIQRLLRSRA